MVIFLTHFQHFILFFPSAHSNVHNERRNLTNWIIRFAVKAARARREFFVHFASFSRDGSFPCDGRIKNLIDWLITFCDVVSSHIRHRRRSPSSLRSALFALRCVWWSTHWIHLLLVIRNMFRLTKQLCCNLM